MFQAEIVLHLDFAKIFVLTSSVAHLGLESRSLSWQVTALPITEYIYTPLRKSVL